MLLTSKGTKHDPRGATRVDATLDFEAAGSFKPAERMLSSSAKKEMEQSLTTLKSKLES